MLTNKFKWMKQEREKHTVDKFLNIASSYQTYLKAVDTVFFVYKIIFLNFMLWVKSSL